MARTKKPPQTLPPFYLNEKQLAARWGVSRKTIQHWRSVGQGVKFYKLGHFVRYKVSDVEAYEANNAFQSTTEALAGGATC